MKKNQQNLIRSLRTAQLLTALAFLTEAQAATYTWIQGGDPTIWDDTLNWQGGNVIPTNEINADMVFSGTATGTLGAGSGTAATKMTFGTASYSTSFDVRMGSFTSAGTITVDTGGPSNGTITYTGGGSHTWSNYYVTWTLNNNLELIGSGCRINVRAYNTNGVTGTGGFIINDGTRLDFVRTHGQDNYAYTGGVTIRSGGIETPPGVTLAMEHLALVVLPLKKSDNCRPLTMN